MIQSPDGNGHAAVSIGLMLHLGPDTQIYCDLHSGQPPALVIGAEPADCVISSANFETQPTDLVAAERLVAAVTKYRNELLRQITNDGGIVRHRAVSDSTAPEGPGRRLPERPCVFPGGAW